MQMVQRSGQQGVPVTEIAGDVIVGFNQPALKAAAVRLRQVQSKNEVKLGAQVADATRVLGNNAIKGALLGSVKPGSLAAISGLRQGDIIVEIQGKPVYGVEELAKALQTISSSSPGLKIIRGGQEEFLTLKLGDDGNPT